MLDGKKHREICEKIIALNPKVRYAGILNMYGKTLAGKIKNGVRPLFKPDEAMSEFFLTAIRETLRKPFERSIGKNHFTMVIHEDVRIAYFGTNEHVLYITFEKDTSYSDMEKVIIDAKRLL